MTHLLDFEKRFLKMMTDLLENPRIEVITHSQGAMDEERSDARSVLEALESWYHVPLDVSLQRCITRFEELAAHWSIDEPGTQLSGEFNLTYLLDAVGNPPPRLAWEGAPESEQQLFSEFRVIDDTPSGGTGKLASIRIRDGATSPEVWFFDVTRGTYKLNIDYCGYMEALLLTKGTYGWQYLFTDISLRGREFQNVVSDLKLMLRTFPALFPDGDYAPLRARLSERLR
ncbi:hypothetical protein [Streptomyces sp. NPDC048637]|uniref:hypothetical protein n=1 Tax=Streptomyces sp. NPDC048637 TaxID=3155636 RepID=UPI003442FD2B